MNHGKVIEKTLLRGEGLVLGIVPLYDDDFKIGKIARCVHIVLTKVAQNVR